MAPVTVLIVDDHEIVRYGISTFLSSHEDIKVVGEASTGEEGLALFKQYSPDICILDINMPEKDGIETARSIRALSAEAKILFLSMHSDRKVIREALKVDINGYLLKSASKGKILSGIRAIQKGQQVYSDSISRMITDYFLEDSVQQQTAAPTITKREREILELIVDGKTSKEIAELLFISPRTVDTHRANLMQKLELNNIADLVRYAIKENIIPA